MLLALILVGGCTTPAPRPVAAPPPLPYVAPPGLARVMGRSPQAVIALLGSPRLDRQEGRTRQLQYVGKSCVLDLFAVAPAAGGTAGIVYAEARTPTGAKADPVACLEGIVPH